MTLSQKKRSFWRSTIFDHLPPCGFVNFIKTPLYFFFLGTTLGDGLVLQLLLADVMEDTYTGVIRVKSNNNYSYNYGSNC